MKGITLEFFFHSSWTGDDYEEIQVCVNEDRSIDYVWIAGIAYDDAQTISLVKSMIGEKAFERLVTRAFSNTPEPENDNSHSQSELEKERRAANG